MFVLKKSSLRINYFLSICFFEQVQCKKSIWDSTFLSDAPPTPTATKIEAFYKDAMNDIRVEQKDNESHFYQYSTRLLDEFTLFLNRNDPSILFEQILNFMATVELES